MKKVFLVAVVLSVIAIQPTFAQYPMPAVAKKGQLYPITHTTSEWKAQLTPAQYHILQEKGTDPPFQNKYDHLFKKGTYYSAASLQPLFSSTAKFDAKTGWPSFYAPITPDAVMLVKGPQNDDGSFEVVDSKTGSHLGDVFNDGPKPTGKRYCMDSNALIFVPEGGKPPTSSKN